MDQQKITAAANECLALMAASDTSPATAAQYLAQLESSPDWNEEEIAAVRSWVTRGQVEPLPMNKIP